MDQVIGFELAKKGGSNPDIQRQSCDSSKSLVSVRGVIIVFEQGYLNSLRERLAQDDQINAHQTPK
jgi:hypothetical protein